MEEEKRRTRIKLGPGPKALPAIFDEAEFSPNRCSPNAKKVGHRINNMTFNVWVDKHYHSRYQLGDENGKREGIEPDRVHEIVNEALNHLVFYSSSVKNFTFVNYNSTPGSRMLRVVCQKEFEGNKTNVIIEVHALSLNEFEVTIVTALQKNDFELSDGQYSVELMGADNSILYYCARRQVREVASI